MKERPVVMLDEKDDEFARILMDIELKRNAARTLVYLANVDEATSRHIELGADLRQPEVSTAMRKLMEENWVEVREIKKEGKGRPVKCYRLAVPIQEIVSKLEKAKQEQVTRDLESIQKLRELGNQNISRI
ncbi:MAG: ArsR family transcriptional regulator [Methanocellales archaeon]|nr:ArsR family transcriptional regulator [Methanocellales archaeon]